MNYRFIDTHCHFDFPPFIENQQKTLDLARDAGIQQLIVPSVTADKFSLIMSLCQKHPTLYGALGLHPNYTGQHTEQALADLSIRLIEHSPKIVAIGEIGLDCDHNELLLAKQQWFLQQQLYLAKQYDLPVLLHVRHNHSLLATMLKSIQLSRTGVIHGFSGSIEQAMIFIRLGYCIGVGGVITYARAKKTRRTMAMLPLTSLLLETDSPDMPVSGFQGQPNRPERIRLIFNLLCQLRTEPAELIAQQIYENSQRVFSFSS